MKIYNFKKGDRIVRVEPSKPLKGPFNNGTRDRSYIGEELKFHGIANGMVYLNPIDTVLNFIHEGKLINLPLDLWDEGWEYWINPQKLDEKLHIPLNIIQRQLEDALDDENYEIAEKLQKLKDEYENNTKQRSSKRLRR